MTNFHAKKASLGEQAKITRFSDPQQHDKQSRSTSPFGNNEAPKPRDLP